MFLKSFCLQLVFGIKLLCFELNVLSPLSNRFFSQCVAISKIPFRYRLVL